MIPSSLGAEVSGQGAQGYAGGSMAGAGLLPSLESPLEQAQPQYCSQARLGRLAFQLMREEQHLSTASLAYGM